MPSKHLAFAILLLAFTAHSGDNTLTYANKTYKTAKIGEQTWLAENLDYEVEGSGCYENISANCAKYGRLYYWETAMKVCPKGWHLPDNAEWEKLLRFVDGSTGTKGTKSPYESPTAGKHLKAARGGWESYRESDGNGTDKYGFSALPGGISRRWKGFNHVGRVGAWWSASEYGSDDACSYAMNNHLDNAYWDRGYKEEVRLSVRCVQD